MAIRTKNLSREVGINFRTRTVIILGVRNLEGDMYFVVRAFENTTDIDDRVLMLYQM